MYSGANIWSNKTNRLVIILLVVVFALDQCAIAFQWGYPWRFITKTLLIPILIYFYKVNVKSVNKLFIAGLVMSFFGDLFLLISGGFIAGLSSFLVAHILYILTFRKIFHRKNTAAILIISIYILGLVGFLFPHLGTMKIPVILYALTIAGMMYMAISTTKKDLIIGAFLFVISDSILALNIFYEHSTISSLSVMFTYVLAQYFLVRGMINNSSTPHSL